MTRHATATGPLPAATRVAVVGSGFSGIGTAVTLRRASRTSSSSSGPAASAAPGGTTPTRAPPATSQPPLLLLLRAQARLSHVYARQPEIRTHLEQVAADAGVLPHLHCDTDVLAGRWDDDALVWRLETSRGPLTAELLASGCGGLVEPHLPQVPGIEDFGARRSTPPAGTRPWNSPARGSPSSAPAPRPRSSCRSCSGRRRGSSSSSGPTAPTPPASSASPGGCPPCSGSPAPAGTGAGRRGCGRSSAATGCPLCSTLTDTVWNAGGCRSWYRDEHGRNVTLWPTHTSTFRRQMRRFDTDAYVLRTVRREAVAGAR